MAGQRIDREARHQLTGLTVPARNAYIVQLRQQGYSERAIAKHLGIAPSNVHYILAAAAGKKRVQVRMSICENGWHDAPASDLDEAGICSACREIGDASGGTALHVADSK